MPRNAAQTYQRIVDTAYELFYRHGYNRVGIDQVAEAAGVTKRTLYYHFESKDELLAKTLEHHHGLALERIHSWGNRLNGSATEIVGALFADLARWTTKKGWSGAGFTRLAMELADMPGHPARTVAKRHKAVIERWLTEQLEQAGVAEPAARAREIQLLIEGATALIVIHGDRKYAEAAGIAAQALVQR